MRQILNGADVKSLTSASGSMPSARPRGLAPWQERRLQTFIEEHFERRLLCRDMAALLNLSTSHFGRCFRGSFGVAPMTYVKQRRVKQAQALLAATALPVAIVALQCGFADQPHMSRVFATLTGCTPAAWRRAQRSGLAGRAEMADLGEIGL